VAEIAEEEARLERDDLAGAEGEGFHLVHLRSASVDGQSYGTAIIQVQL
jgi:hypothetical protein